MGESAFLEGAKAIGPAVVALVIGLSTIWINRMQVRISEQQMKISKSQRDIALEKLKHELFEKRYAIYSAYLKLAGSVSGALGLRSEAELDADFNAASIEFSKSMFLLDVTVEEYLQVLHERLFKNVQERKILFGPLAEQMYSTAKDRAEAQHLHLKERAAFLEEWKTLQHHFAPYLKLSGFNTDAIT